MSALSFQEKQSAKIQKSIYWKGKRAAKSNNLQAANKASGEGSAGRE